MARVCSKCKTFKEDSSFYKRGPSKGLRGDCKECNKLHRSKCYKKAQQYNPLLRRSVVLKHKYGITQNEYSQMLYLQHGKCAICNRHHTEFKKPLAVDHCHKTGKIRGLLCIGCNIGLGSFRDNVVTITKAIEYLKETT